MAKEAGDSAPAQISTSVSRALRQASAHPSVINIDVEANDSGSSVARLTIRSELPARWRASGRSPFGVLRDEKVTVRFPKRFPIAPPTITLRDDFPRNHPHIQPGRSDAPVEPCLVLGSVREILQARGFFGLMEQLADWLDKASSLSLNDPKAGWEPVRRDRIDDIASFDASKVRQMASGKAGAAYCSTVYLHYAGGEGFYKIHSDLVPEPFRNNQGQFFKRTNHQDYDTGIGEAVIAWPDSRFEQEFTCDEYLPETVTNLGQLLKRAQLYGCEAPVKSKLSHMQQVLGRNPAPGPFPLLVALLARRPYPLVGTTSPIELCTYMIEVDSNTNLSDPDTSVRLVAHRDIVSSELLRQTSGFAPATPATKWTLIGCGSVGSKIALHTSRAGCSPAVMIDRSTISAHNFARHTAIPNSNFDGLFFEPKASLVRSQVGKLAQSCDAYRLDVVPALEHPSGREVVAPEDTALVLDTTGSLVTREALVHADWGTRPRLGEACLMGAGKLAYLVCEGGDGNPTLSDLAVEAYRTFSLDGLLASRAFGAEAEQVVIGQGCSASTFIMSDSQLSVPAASMASIITEWLEGEMGESGQLRIGSVGKDGSLAWQATDEPPWLEVSTPEQEIEIRMHPRVHEAILADIAKYPGVETGGVLVGRFSAIGNKFQIVDFIDAPPDSKRSPAEFVLGTEGLKQKVLGVARLTGGALQAVGTWHHHLAETGPSTTDQVAGALLALRQNVPTLLLIRTPTSYNSLIAEALFEEAG